MAKEETYSASHGDDSLGATWGVLFTTGLYKPSQGKIVRQVTFAAVALIFAVACYQLSAWSVLRKSPATLYGVPLGIFLLGLWISFRVVNIPRFADFLIAVQAEMNKVSWPTQQELIRNSIVVIVMIVMLAAVLFGLDMFWMWSFKWLGIIKS